MRLKFELNTDYCTVALIMLYIFPAVRMRRDILEILENNVNLEDFSGTAYVTSMKREY